MGVGKGDDPVRKAGSDASQKTTSAKEVRQERVPPEPLNVLQFSHIGRLGTALSFDNVELDLLPFFQSAIAVAVNCGIMDEDVVSAIHSNESVTLLAVEPFHRSLHYRSPPE